MTFYCTYSMQQYTVNIEYSLHFSKHIHWTGTFHGAEIPYAFGWPLIGLSEEVRQDTRIFVDIIPYNEEDIAYAEFMADLWTNFAKFS